MKASGNIIQRRIVVKGRVQGVGFRYWTRARVHSDFPSIKGWVRNLENNDVEALLQGPEELVESFILELWKGPPLSRVDDIRVVEEPVEENISAFMIRK